MEALIVHNPAGIHAGRTELQENSPPGRYLGIQRGHEERIADLERKVKRLLDICERQSHLLSEYYQTSTAIGSRLHRLETRGDCA